MVHVSRIVVLPILAILVASVLVFPANVPKVEATGTIYIRADGSVDPPIAPINTVDNMTYILIDNIHDSVIVQRNNIVVDGAGHTVTGNGSGNGTMLTNKSNVTIRNMAIENFDNGIYLDYSSGDTLSGNNVVSNAYGIYLHSYSDSVLSGNNVANNDQGIVLDSSCSGNTLSGNNITANNMYGIYARASSSNSAFHNSFVNNTSQVYTEGSNNTWDDGFLSGGNYWSDYEGADGNGDGIGDTPYFVDVNNTDRYPLMALYGTFDAGTWNGTTCSVGVMSNSTVSEFQVDVADKTIDFNVTGAEGSAGFCRVTIPNIIVQNLWHGNYTVLVDGKPWPFSNWTDTTNTYVYFSYTHSLHQVVIIPEIPSFLILPMLMTATLLATIASRRKRSKHQASSQCAF
jgi:parallel beta-helix repeat protein